MQTHVPLRFRLQFCGGPYIDDKVCCRLIKRAAQTATPKRPDFLSHQSTAICLRASARKANHADSTPIRRTASLKFRNARAPWMAFRRSSRIVSDSTEREESCMIAHSCTSNFVGSGLKRSVETIRFAISHSSFCQSGRSGSSPTCSSASRSRSSETVTTGRHRYPNTKGIPRTASQEPR
jgi:hypothetical protein